MAISHAAQERTLLLLHEIEKFRDPANGQRLHLIAKKLGMSKQNLNYFLKKMTASGMIKKAGGTVFSVYEITPFGGAVKENLIQSDGGVKNAIWRVHNIITGHRVLKWGS